MKEDTLNIAAERTMDFYKELLRFGIPTEGLKRKGLEKKKVTTDEDRLECWRLSIDRAAKLYGLTFDELARRLKK